MYYPKSQITTALYTSGGELLLRDSPYSGYYYQTSDGRYFSNKSPDDIPTYELFPINNNSNATSSLSPVVPTNNPNKKKSYYLIRGIYSVIPDSDQLAPSPPTLISPQPSEEDYELGEFVRYFAYKPSAQNTIEIDKEEYNQLTSNSPSIQYELYTPVILTWVLKGKRQNVFQANGNLVRLKENSQNIPNFSKYFRGRYAQYYRFGKNENLYSDGKELRYTKTKKPYIGYYHIHPEKGPMVGRQHTMEIHDYLEFIPTGSTLNPIQPSAQSGSYVEPTKSIPKTSGGY
jgi:hypothetical protein